MTTIRRHIHQDARRLRSLAIGYWLLFMGLGLLLPTQLQAQTYEIRYVDSEHGAFTNDGLTWATAKNNLQAAIDEVYEAIKNQPGTLGYVYVAQGTYVPTRRSTDDADGSMFNTSFRIPERVYIFGGFAGNETPDEGKGEETLPGKRLMENDATYAQDELEINADDMEHSVRRWNFKHKTILSGNHSLTDVTFTYNEQHDNYDTSFPLNSYHVVWFGTNGTIPVDAADYASNTEAEIEAMRGHFNGLAEEACVDGCTIEGGYASSRNSSTHDHTGYGGGAYMVKNALLRNCIVQKCASTMRGGGVYMDGGGTVERCYINTCQASGVGVVQGYGGGAAIDYNGSVQHSYITQSAARVGGGLAICHSPGEYPVTSAEQNDATFVASSQFDPFCTATVISNNTGNAEAGGVYLDEGGTLNHCTIVNNKCTGPDVVYYGQRHGRTGGVYVRTSGTIYNSVAWGNSSPVNNDVQFASYQGRNVTSDDVIRIYHSAFSNHDITNWANASKDGVISLSSKNVPDVQSDLGNFPMFQHPTVKAGIQYNSNGSLPYNETGAGQAYQKVFNWHPLAATSLRMKAVQVTDAIQGISEEVKHAHTDVDVVGRRFEALSSCGALARTERAKTYAMLPSLENATEGNIPTVFVDPNRRVFGQLNTNTSEGWDDNDPVGDSWYHPVGNLSIAVSWFRDIYNPADGLYHFSDGRTSDKVQIFVKEGTMITAGTGAYLGTQARTAAVRPVSGMRLYGSFPASNVGTDVSGRNQRTTPTRLTANILNDTYQNNGAHIFALINVKNVVIDGFRGYSGNANLGTGYTYSTEDVRYGGGVIVNNTSRPQDERIDMTGNIIRNCVFANCSAPMGSTIYVNGGNKKADGTLSRAELTVLNTVIRNSTAGEIPADQPDYFVTTPTDAGVVAANGNAQIWLRNCDIVNNTGYALKTWAKDEDGNLGTIQQGQIQIFNSILFSNGLTISHDRSTISNPVSCDWTTSNNTISGDYIYLDYDAEKPEMPDNIHCFNILTRVKADNNTEKTTWDGKTVTVRYPFFVNPSRNVGHSTGDDQPLYGGNVSYEPLNMNPIVNGANTVTTTNDMADASYNGGFDNRSLSYDAAWNKRTYGGAPDAGAVENINLPEKGKVKYVRTPDDGGSDDNDGNSWATAYATIRKALESFRGDVEFDYNSDGKATKVIPADIEVWVAAGTYHEHDGSPAGTAKGVAAVNGDDDIVVLVPGVNLYGGFVPYGNPGKELKDGERNIANSDSLYQTIIDGDNKGRVVSMLDNFPTETIMEGFTIQRGHNPKAAVTHQVTMWKEEVTDSRAESYDPTTDGWDSYDGFEWEECSAVEYSAASPENRKTEVVQEKSTTPPTDGTQYQTSTEVASVTIDRDDWLAGIGNDNNNRKQANSQANAVNGYFATGGTQTTVNQGSYWDNNVPTRNVSYTWNGNTLTVRGQRTGNQYYQYQVNGYDYYVSEQSTPQNVSVFGYNYYTTTIPMWKYAEYYHIESTTVYTYDVTKYYRKKFYKVDRIVAYVPDVDNYPRHQENVNNVWIDAGHVETNIGFPRQGRDYRDGGGVRMYANGVLKNCLVWKNKIRTDGDVTFAAGAALLKGSRMESSIVRNNVLENVWVNNGVFTSISRGGGVHAAGATVINSLIVENVALNGQAFQGVGLYISEKSDFYQCTIAYNFGIAGNPDNSQYATNYWGQVTRDYRYTYVAPGVWDDSNRTANANALNSSNVCVFNNCIIWGNAGIGPTCTNYAQHYVADTNADTDYMSAAGSMYNLIGMDNLNLFNHCYHSIPGHSDYYAMATGDENVFNTDTYTVGFVARNSAYNNYNVYNVTNTKAFWDACQAKNLFNESEEGYKFDPFMNTTDNYVPDYQTSYINATNATYYTADNIIARASKNPYNINEASALAIFNINTGDDASPAHMKDTYGITIDINGAARVQDCQVDKGAYEYDGTKDIEPDLTQEGKAIFYVSQNGGGGLATANSPANAACATKLQKVLDAAGRWKYAANFYNVSDSIRTNFTEEVLRAELIDQGVATNDNVNTYMQTLKERTVIVKLAGDYTTTKTDFNYVPTRTSVTNYEQEENLLEYSLIVPRGIQVMGGYDDTFNDVTRDVLGNPARFSGYVTNEASGASGSVFHTVTFTNDLYDLDEKLYLVGDEYKTNQLAGFTEEKDRAVLDGLFIVDGAANGTDTRNRIGGGAVVTEYAHIKNCIVMNNSAQNYGGGLYLEPRALVSGTIVRDNSATTGGGIYVEPSKVENDPMPNARIYTSTILYNTAALTGGGVYFSPENPNLIANSTVFWANTANDLANVAGNLDAMTQGEGLGANSYAFNYCAVESRRVPGINNLQLSSTDSEGVRWDHHARWENQSYDGLINYVPITMSSVLARSGMTYNSFEIVRQTYPTIEEEDMARLNRMEQSDADVITMAPFNNNTQVSRVHKDNAFIDMGARALNKTFEVDVVPENILHRLFVAKSEYLPSPQLIEALQEGTYEGSNVYSQMGSSFINPFIRLGDAFDYIAKARSYYDTSSGTYPYRNDRFEVFVTKGDFYPFRDAYGQQSDARMNTFLVPEATTVVGGVQATETEHRYCQKGYGETDATDLSFTVTHNGATYNIQFDGATTQTIRDERARVDYNGNGIYEPWELQSQTRLLGNAVDINSEGETNIYHVMVCMADEDQVGKLPEMRDQSNQVINYDERITQINALSTNDERQKALLSLIQSESQDSQDKRMIFIDGLQISGGHANDIMADHATLREIVDGEWTGATPVLMSKRIGETDGEFASRKDRQNATQLTYFRGGGILVEGNWNQDFLTQGTLPEVLGVARRHIPLTVVNCEFQNNQAGNGGAIYSNGSLYVVSCHFTQNLAMGPQTQNDQRFIPWTAGGAIASNYHLDVWNTLFDNNEARRGNYAILTSAVNPRNTSDITNSDARQGSGGVISASETSVVRVMNCDMVKNKALQFPAIYNFYDNDLRKQDEERWGPGHHFAVNTVFWGNSVPNEYKDLPIATAEETTPAADQRKRYHVANFAADLSEEVLYFCAFEPGTALEAKVPDTDEERRNQRKTAVSGQSDMDNIKTGAFFNTNFATYNNNQYVNSDNNAVDGPFFNQPSSVPGIDGYMQNSDWMVNRLNALIDTGWSYLEQLVSQPHANSPKLVTNFYAEDTSKIYDKDNTLAGSEDAHTELTHIDAYASNGESDGLAGDGFYKTFSKSVYDRFKPYGYNNLLPIAEEAYMPYLREGSSKQSNMLRISTYPKVGEQEVYIDIGVYEYQYVQLNTLGNEVDVVWVGPESRGDGSTAQACTNNLQLAIETLLLSRNGHDKVVKLLGGNDPNTPAEYAPTLMTSNNQLAFFVKTPSKDDGVSNPSAAPDDAYGIKSLTIRGGYNPNTGDEDDGEALRDIERYPTVITMANMAGFTDQQKSHLFVIEDAQQKVTWGNYIQERVSRFENEGVPIVIEGITFSNPYAIQTHDPEYDGGSAIIYRQQYEQELQANGEVTRPEGNPYLRPAYDVERYTADDPDVVSGNAKVGRVKMENHQVVHNDVELPKLIIKDCIFKNNGTADNDVQAVRIREGGGEALVVNSLFHSNHGAPLYAVNTKVVNCTFSKNDKHLTLGDMTERYRAQEGLAATGEYHSMLHNSLIWKDNVLSHNEGIQYRFLDGNQPSQDPSDPSVNVYPDITATKIASADYFSHNAITGYKANGTEEIMEEEETNGYNISLSDDNNDMFLGPNFVDPENEDVAQRDFHVNVSNRVINRANTGVYTTHVPYHETYSYSQTDGYLYKYNNLDPWATADEARQYCVTRHIYEYDENDPEVVTSDTPYFFQSVQRGPKEVLDELKMRTKEATGSPEFTEIDLASQARLQGSNMERGAYESEVVLQRVLYVDGEGGASEKNGLQWETAYALENLQDAIDVASIYYMTSADETADRERAYVFVKGDDVTAPTVKVRDGVSVYGSLKRNFLEEAIKDKDEQTIGEETFFTNYTDEEVARYVRQVESGRDGIAMRGATTTTIAGLESDNSNGGKDFDEGFLLNGFVVTAPTSQATPVVKLDKTQTAVSGSIITGNTVTDNQPVAQIDKGLLYNTLVYDNTASPLVTVGDNGYVLNVTIVADDGQTGISGQTGDEHVKNTIVAGPAGAMFAPYRNETNAYQLPDYLTSWKPYWYQLHEMSNSINVGNDDNTIAAAFPKYVNYGHDRDVLGNPRRLNTSVDDGCFEAWYVTDSRFATNATRIKTVPATLSTQAVIDYTDYSDNYGGHSYPHPGSVVYVMNNADLVLNVNGTEEVMTTSVGNIAAGQPLFAGNNALRPGYLLVKDGGSVYGQGNTLQAAYVAAEKVFTEGNKSALVTMPFDYDTQNALVATHDDATDSFTETLYTAFSPYSYDGEARSHWRNFTFKTEDSDCWTPISDTEREANEGWLMERTATDAEVVRFTGWAKTEGDYAYEEDGSVKTVSLTQYNSTPADGTAHFTRLENMGWNLKGMPWLVSTYRTFAMNDEGAYDGSSHDYQMNIPHVVYSNLAQPLGDPSTANPIYTSGQFYASQSWADGSQLRLNDAYFTQTAVIGNGTTETLRFSLPVFTGETTAAARPMLMVMADDGEESTRSGMAHQLAFDLITVAPNAEAEKVLTYRHGTDGVKLPALDDEASLVYLLSAEGTPLSLAADAPTEVEMPLGIRAAKSGSYTFTLPYREAYEEYQHVWLSDHATGTVTDLMADDYTLTVTADDAVATRSGEGDSSQGYGLTLQIGGMRPGITDLNHDSGSYRIGVDHELVKVYGTRDGDTVAIYTAGGALVVRGTARGDMFQQRVTPGVYVVRVNGYSKTVVARQ